MTTRELIEEVHRVESFMGSPSVNGVRIPTACVRSTDYDALRAATLAVLDEVIADCKQCDGSGERESWSSAGYHVSECRLCSNARALRERLK